MPIHSASNEFAYQMMRKAVLKRAAFMATPLSYKGSAYQPLAGQLARKFHPSTFEATLQDFDLYRERGRVVYLVPLTSDVGCVLHAAGAWPTEVATLNALQDHELKAVLRVTDITSDAAIQLHAIYFYRKFCNLIGKNPEACRPFLLNSQGDHP